jgi:hypothetical protein
MDKSGQDYPAGKRKACTELGQIPKTDRDTNTRYALVENLTDQALLDQISMTESDWHARRAARLAITVARQANISFRAASQMATTAGCLSFRSTEIA